MITIVFEITAFLAVLLQVYFFLRKGAGEIDMRIAFVQALAIVYAAHFQYMLGIQIAFMLWLVCVAHRFASKTHILLKFVDFALFVLVGSIATISLGLYP